MMDMEITQRMDEGDMEVFEEGSKYRLELNIWKTEREWQLMKRHEAKSTPAAADEENNTQAEEEHRGQENEANKEKDQSGDKEGHGNTEAPSRATCGKDLEGVKLKTMISHAATMMDEPEEEQEPCDDIPDTTFSVGASAVLSNRPNKDTVEGKTQEQEEAEFHVNSSVADLGGKYDTCGNLA